MKHAVIPPKLPCLRGFSGRIETAPTSACNTRQGLTRSSGTSREGLPVMVPKTCSIPECAARYRSGGFCMKHLQEHRTAGLPVADMRLRTSKAPLESVPCKIDGCGNDSKYRGKALCQKHYRRFVEHGQFDLIEPPSFEIQLFGGIAIGGNGCWVWQGTITSEGYGRISHRGETKYTHRLAWELTNGEIPDNADIDHTCHNRACFNVEHLRVATRKQNSENKGVLLSNNTSGFQGVHQLPSGRFVSYVRHNGKRRHLGMFDHAETAADTARQARNALFTHNDKDRAL